MDLTDSERAIALISAFGASVEHEEAGGSRDNDDAGQLMLDIVDEISDGIIFAETPQGLIDARDVLFGTIVAIIGIGHGAFARLDPEIDLQDIVQHSAIAAHRRALTA